MEKPEVTIQTPREVMILKPIKVEFPKPTQPADMDIQGGSATDSRYERYWDAKC